MSEDAGGERASDEKNGPAETRPDDQLVGDDESGYGGAGADDVGAEHVVSETDTIAHRPTRTRIRASEPLPMAVHRRRNQPWKEA